MYQRHLRKKIYSSRVINNSFASRFGQVISLPFIHGYAKDWGVSLPEDRAGYVSSYCFQFSKDVQVQLQLTAKTPLLLFQKEEVCSLEVKEQGSIYNIICRCWRLVKESNHISKIEFYLFWFFFLLKRSQIEFKFRAVSLTTRVH